MEGKRLGEVDLRVIFEAVFALVMQVGEVCKGAGMKQHLVVSQGLSFGLAP